MSVSAGNKAKRPRSSWHVGPRNSGRWFDDAFTAPLIARYEAGERAQDIADCAGVTLCALVGFMHRNGVIHGALGARRPLRRMKDARNLNQTLLLSKKNPSLLAKDFSPLARPPQPRKRGLFGGADGRT